MSKEELQEYIDIMELVRHTENRIKGIEDTLKNLEGRVDTADIVMGGVGGGHRFHIEGSEECTRIKSELYAKKLSLNRLEAELLKRGRRVEEFIAGINEARKKRIFILRYIDGMSWNEVAENMGPGNSPDAVRMEHNRYVKKYGDR